ncbi:hypothetical protein F442_07246 [Phytophthora nicotianae P10297]|uniref:Uncharacterized protein n=1 Tax=Phytophthora nicotianae P10297 TaxID=1317064 RepID=W2ZHI8_PHYNI|nr:hypothetical protein F442_07246 [Phytophthora nicotianae P10297]
MTNVNWSQLEKKVAEIKRNTVSARSRAVYQNSYGRFVAWVVLHKPQLLTPAFAQRLGDVSDLSIKQLRKTHLNLDEANPPLQFDVLQSDVFELLQQTPKDMLFAMAYMVISSNLMCRSANAFGIRHGHMEWSGDALGVYFAHQKNDQEGRRPRDPRHIYTNPLRPAICPVLALAIFWATSPFDGSDRLFPGSNQYERFRKCLQQLFDRDCVAEELHRRGVDRDELAGDMHVGRTVSGLPPDSHEFAVLPPHFEERDEKIENAIDCSFPGMPANLTYIGEFCLASLVYHEPYLRLNIPKCHPLFEPPFFQHPTLVSDLLAKIVLAGCMLQVCHPRASTVKEIMSELEKRAIGAGTVTFEGLDLALKRCLDTVGVMDLVNKLNTTPVQTSCQLVEGETPVIPSFFWGGRFRRVPQEFQLPDCSVATLWVMWQCGNATKKIPPLRMLDGLDTE